MISARQAAVLVFGAWALSAASMVFAQKPAPKPREVMPLHEAVGRLQKVDPRSQVVVVDGVTLKVDQTTTIFVDGRTGALTDLSEGEVVRAAYEPGQASPVAQWIERAAEKR